MKLLLVLSVVTISMVQGAEDRSVVPIVTLVEGVSSYSQRNPPESGVRFQVRAVLPRFPHGLHPRLDDYVKLAVDPARRVTYLCPNTRGRMAQCRLRDLVFEVLLSADTSGHVEMQLDGGTQAIIEDIHALKFEVKPFVEMQQIAQGNSLGNSLVLLVPAMTRQGS